MEMNTASDGTGSQTPIVEREEEGEGTALTDAVLKAAVRNKLKAKQFAVPGKRKLPIHDRAHAKSAWSMLKRTEDLTPAEYKIARRRILAALKRFGVTSDPHKAKAAMTDAARPANVSSDARPAKLSDDARRADVSASRRIPSAREAGRPANVSDDEFRQILAEELTEYHQHLRLTDVYSSGGYVLAYHSDICPACGRWSDCEICEYCGAVYGVCLVCKDDKEAEGRYRVPFEIVSQDDDDGDIDLVNVTFGDPVMVRMVPEPVSAGIADEVKRRGNREMIESPGEAEAVEEPGDAQAIGAPGDANAIEVPGDIDEGEPGGRLAAPDCTDPNELLAGVAGEDASDSKRSLTGNAGQKGTDPRQLLAGEARRQVPGMDEPTAGGRKHQVTDPSKAQVSDGKQQRINPADPEPEMVMVDSTGEVFFDDVAPQVPRNISTSADAKAGRLRIRLKGPRANVVNHNNRVYPLHVLKPAVERAGRRARSGGMIAYLPHPEQVTAPDGTTTFRCDPHKSAAKIDDWSIDESGQVFVDYTLYDATAPGRLLRERVETRSPIGTSVRAVGESKTGRLDGRPLIVATQMDILSNDFVDNPALGSAMGHAIVLTDEVLDGLEPMTDESASTSAMGQQPAVATAEQDEPEKAKQENNTEEVPMADQSKNPAAAQAQDGNGKVTVDAVEYRRLQAFANNDTLKEMLAEAEDRKRRTAVKAFVDSIRGGQEVEVPGRGKVKLDLSRFDEDEMQLILDSVSNATMDDVFGRLESWIAYADKNAAKNKLKGMGYKLSIGSGKGKTVDNGGVQVFVDEAEKTVQQHITELTTAMDRVRHKMQPSWEPSSRLRQANQPFIDEVMKGWCNQQIKGGAGRTQMEALVDASKTFLDDSASTANLLQQPTITPATAALITQIYWQLTWMSLAGGIGPEGFNAGPGSDAGIGLNLRVPVETRQSGQDPIFVPEGGSVPTIHTLLYWLNFQPMWRKTAFDLTKEAQIQLERGAARYDALARQLYLIAQVIAENIDVALANEHLNASDEYLAVQVASETAGAGTVIVSSPTIAAAGYNTSTVKSYYKIATTYGGNSGGPFTIGGSGAVQFSAPIVPQRTTQVLQEDGSIQTSLNTVLNPIAVTVGGTQLTMGLINSAGNIINDPSLPVGSPPAQFAVDYENGVFVFTATGTAGTPNATNGTSGVDATHLPTVAYSYVTNMDFFDLGPSSAAADLGIFYDGLLRRINYVSSVMGQAPRYSPPTDVMFNLQSAVYAESARQSATLFAPRGGEVSIGGPKPTRFGRWGDENGVDLNKCNTPWRAGSGRILLFSRGRTKYGIQYPFTVEGPYMKQAIVVDNTQPSGYSNAPVGNSFWLGQQNSVICTPVAFTESSPGVVSSLINHPYRTIKLLNTATL
jgi:hypothetical protein